MQLINLDGDEVRAVENLLIEIGISSKLGAFLAEHLSQVLRKQHNDAIIQSIEFIGARGCSAEGYQSPDNDAINVYNICIPLDVKVTVAIKLRRLVLSLYVQVVAINLNTFCDVKTNVFVVGQSSS
jgi:hypothetical protein